MLFLVNFLKYVVTEVLVFSCYSK